MNKPISILFLVLILFFSSCSNSDDINLKPITDDSIEVINAFPNLTFSRPLDLQSPSDGTNRIFVVEQGGAIKVFENNSDVSESSTFLDISGNVASSDELGLLGLAFHPDFDENGYFFVCYTPTNDLSVISRFKTMDGESNVADPNSELVLLRVPQPYTNHNGGQLAFGPDGYLYIAMGDGGSGGDPDGNAQNLENLLGAILRVDVNNTETGLNYAIPNDNPFVEMDNARPEIYAYGLRNPWRFSFDSQNGNLWTGDVGQGEKEEVNIIASGGNYGWNILEGTSCYNAQDCDDNGTIAPVFEYGHGNNDKSVTGGYVYRGSLIPELNGYYIFGDFISGRIWALDNVSGTAVTSKLLFETGLNISSFGTDQDNEIYICSFDGKIYKLVMQEGNLP
ncbi:PQQ-dependent sugar dehydrogenase [Maribacter cobaltidurans]|uniref:Glucose sorbosone dehydrogenase n=1 Tax=Maribacter cobaltidurans TaxID=1178778 RepID=A0A223V7Y2_9FLAO|nr:PQQ-dependent sugar dehydrogenase [Maribacter cobaltidurans]ASV31406.1 glucose sorbosone dehydrogenase [Maribacter cobaltidurans]GGD82530.1 protein up-regulated by thyroid hormone-PQQ-dependent glucose dehydrogenase [Maribacter cobaltidurans]